MTEITNELPIKDINAKAQNPVVFPIFAAVESPGQSWETGDVVLFILCGFDLFLLLWILYMRLLLWLWSGKSLPYNQLLDPR